MHAKPAPAVDGGRHSCRRDGARVRLRPLRTSLLSAVMALVSPSWARPTLGHSGYTSITREHVPRTVLLRALRCESKPFDSVWLLTTLYLRRTVLLNHHSRRVLAP